MSGDDIDLNGQKLLTKILVRLQAIDGKFDNADLIQKHNDETLSEIKDDIKEVKEDVKNLTGRVGEIEIQLRGKEPGVSCIVEQDRRIESLEDKDTKSTVKTKTILAIIAGVWAVIQVLISLAT